MDARQLEYFGVSQTRDHIHHRHCTCSATSAATHRVGCRTRCSTRTTRYRATVRPHDCKAQERVSTRRKRSALTMLSTTTAAGFGGEVGVTVRRFSLKTVTTE